METRAKRAYPGQYLTFALHSETYGVPISVVREINQIVEITHVPQAPAFVLGVMNLRGRVLPVVDLRVRFGLEKTPFTKQTCIIVIDSEMGQVGIIVDSVSEVIEFSSEQIEETPMLGDEERMSYVLGLGKVDKKVVILVDIARNLSKSVFQLGDTRSDSAA